MKDKRGFSRGRRVAREGQGIMVEVLQEEEKIEGKCCVQKEVRKLKPVTTVL